MKKPIEVHVTELQYEVFLLRRVSARFGADCARESQDAFGSDNEIQILRRDTYVSSVWRKIPVTSNQANDIRQVSGLSTVHATEFFPSALHAQNIPPER